MWGLLIAGIGTVAAVSVWRLPGAEAVELHCTLTLGGYIATLLTSLGLYVRWRLTGEAPTGLLAAAMAVSSAPPVLLWVVPLGTDVHVLLQGGDQPTQVAALLPTAVLLTRSTRAPHVDTALNPAALTAIYGSAALALVVATSLARRHGMFPESDLPMLAADVLTAAICVAFVWAFRRHAQSLAPGVALRVSNAFLCMALAALLAGLSRLDWAPLWLLSGYIRLIAAGLLLLLALALVHNVVSFTGERLSALGLRADSAEETIRLEQERLHELRSTVAGIRGASTVLSRRHYRLDGPRADVLQQMVAAELERLERLMSSDAGKSAAPQQTALDDVIRPLVVRHRHAGMTVSWQAAAVSAFIRADEVAEIINVLLTNAHQHAPGAPVWVDVEECRDVVRVRVEDGGPGVPPALADGLFERGFRGQESSGQGLGLHIGSRLAADQGGDLHLGEPAHGTGACFTLTLRRRPAPHAHTAAEDALLEDAR